MKRVFPLMYNRISAGYAAAVYIYWFIAFIFIPFVMPFVAYGLWDDMVLLSWIDCGYYVMNGVVTVILLKSHLVNSFHYLRRNPKKFAITLLITCVLMSVVIATESLAYGDTFNILYAFPMTNFEVMMTSSLTAASNPVFGTIIITLFVPIAISGLFYAPGFAPICCKRPWLAYIMVSVLLLTVAGFDILWRGNADAVLTLYFMRLPIHLLACWSYEKTDSIWAPIFSLGILNLLSSLTSVAILR